MSDKKIVEIRCNSKFGKSVENQTVSLIFSDNTCTYFEQEFTYKDAKIFIWGIEKGLELAEKGFLCKT